MLDKALEHAAEETLYDKAPKPKKPWVSEATLKLITEKHAMDRRGDSENFKKQEKEVRRELRKDWTFWAENLTDKELDIRDKWLGIKQLKRKVTRKLYESADMHGNVTAFKQQTDAAADYLEQKQWGNGEQENTGETTDVRTKKQNKTQNTFRLDLFDEEELNYILKKMKKRKSYWAGRYTDGGFHVDERHKPDQSSDFAEQIMERWRIPGRQTTGLHCVHL